MPVSPGCHACYPAFEWKTYAIVPTQMPDL
jgi:hypothetical protein